MMIPGLVSVTYRKLTPEQIVPLAAGAGLASIEWGGDVHVPHGDVGRARAVGRATADAGLRVSAYGSYYRAGGGGAQEPTFRAALDSAVALGAPVIRVWAGNVGSAQADDAMRKSVVEDLRRVCDLAGPERITISLEFHGGTLTDTTDSALALIREVNHPNLASYWQPPVGMEKKGCLASLRRMLPHVRDLHVFHWWPDHAHRRPLSEGADRWRDYLQVAAEGGKPRHASLEFVAGDDPERLRLDADTLRSLL